MATLAEPVRKLIEAPNFGHLATLMADGSPQVTPVWVDTDGEHVLVNTAHGRQKPRNLARDGRVALTIADQSNPYRYAEVRGEVVETVAGPEARAHIDQLSMKYNGHEYRNRIVSERLIVRIKPLRQLLRGV